MGRAKEWRPHSWLPTMGDETPPLLQQGTRSVDQSRFAREEEWRDKDKAALGKRPGTGPSWSAKSKAASKRAENAGPVSHDFGDGQMLMSGREIGATVTPPPRRPRMTRKTKARMDEEFPPEHPLGWQTMTRKGDLQNWRAMQLAGKLSYQIEGAAAAKKKRQERQNPQPAEEEVSSDPDDLDDEESRRCTRKLKLCRPVGGAEWEGWYAKRRGARQRAEAIRGGAGPSVPQEQAGPSVPQEQAGPSVPQEQAAPQVVAVAKHDLSESGDEDDLLDLFGVAKHQSKEEDDDLFGF